MAAGSRIAITAVLKDIEAALTERDHERASALAREALDAGLEHPFLLNLRAEWHDSAGRSAEALGDLQRALVLAPGSASVRTALGMACAKARRLLDAMAYFESALACDSGFGPAQFNKARTAEELGDLATARDCYARAHECAPGHPDPIANLASLATRFGAWQDAKTLSQRALALNPRHALAQTVLAAAEISEGARLQAERRLRTLLARSDVPSIDYGAAGGMLGDLLDGDARYAEAFAAYATGNAAMRRHFAPVYEGPGVETTAMFLRWNRSLFEETDPAEWVVEDAPLEESADGHAFVLGFPRCGTTLLEQVLGSHPDVVTSGERDALIDGTEAFLGTPDGMRKLAAARGADLAPFRRAYWNRVRDFGLRAEGRMFIDKQPYNTLKLPLIAKLFPHAKIVFAVRDPRDVVLSCFRRRFRMSPPNFQLLTLEGAAGFYDQVMQLAAVYRARLPLGVLQLRYKDLVGDFEPRVRAVCDFIGIGWSDRLRDFAAHAATQAIATPSAVQLRQGLNLRGSGHWRHYAEQLAPVLPVLRPWIERFGYEPE